MGGRFRGREPLPLPRSTTLTRTMGVLRRAGPSVICVGPSTNDPTLSARSVHEVMRPLTSSSTPFTAMRMCTGDDEAPCNVKPGIARRRSIVRHDLLDVRERLADLDGVAVDGRCELHLLSVRRARDEERDAEREEREERPHEAAHHLSLIPRTLRLWPIFFAVSCWTVGAFSSWSSMRSS